MRAVTQKPIKFLGIGEKLDALEVFHADRLVSRILGMGDVLSLVEKAQSTFDIKEAERLQQKIKKSQFDLEDFRNQLQQIKKMGNMKDLLGMIPGVGKAIRDVDISNDSFKQIEAIIQSMTAEERQQPGILSGSRRTRIAKGSGTTVQDVNRLLKQFEDMRKMMKMMSNKDQAAKMMRNMPGMRR